MAKIKGLTILPIGKDGWQGHGATGALTYQAWECETVQLLWSFLKNLDIHLLDDRAIPITGITVFTSSVSGTWELVRNVHSQATPDLLKFKNHCSKARKLTLIVDLSYALPLCFTVSCEVKKFYSHLTEKETEAQRGHLTDSGFLPWPGLEFGPRSGLCWVRNQMIALKPPQFNLPPFPSPPTALPREGCSLALHSAATHQGL